jgi:hypothetical protein
MRRILSFTLSVSIFAWLILAAACKKDNGGSSTDIMSGSTTYSGAYPAPGVATYPAGSTSHSTFAYPGQVNIFFNASASESDANYLITAQGGTVLAKIPAIGYYFVSTGSASVLSFITAIQSNALIDIALPDAVGSPKTGASVLDNCGGVHGNAVKATLQTCGGTMDDCETVTENGTNTAPLSKVIAAIGKEANKNKSGTTLINLSYNGGYVDIDFASQSTACQDTAVGSIFTYMTGVFMTIGALPEELRRNLVLTIAAGNENVPLQGILDFIRQRPRMKDIMTNNVLIVSTERMPGIHGNYDYTDPDVVILNNSDAVMGTSLAAPCAMGYIQGVMAQKGVSAREALKAIKLASQLNPTREVLLGEAYQMVNIPSFKGTDFTMPFGPYAQQNGPLTCYQTLNFDLSPTLYWKTDHGTMNIPAHYHRELESNSSGGCIMTGVTTGDYTFLMTLSGNNNDIYGEGTINVSSGGTSTPVIASFAGMVTTQGNVAGTLKLNMANHDSVSTLITLTKQ